MGYVHCRYVEGEKVHKNKNQNKIPTLASSLLGGPSACRAVNVESHTFALAELSPGNSDS